MRNRALIRAWCPYTLNRWGAIIPETLKRQCGGYTALVMEKEWFNPVKHKLLGRNSK